MNLIFLRNLEQVRSPSCNGIHLLLWLEQRSGRVLYPGLGQRTCSLLQPLSLVIPLPSATAMTDASRLYLQAHLRSLQCFRPRYEPPTCTITSASSLLLQLMAPTKRISTALSVSCYQTLRARFPPHLVQEDRSPTRALRSRRAVVRGPSSTGRPGHGSSGLAYGQPQSSAPRAQLAPTFQVVSFNDGA